MGSPENSFQWCSYLGFPQVRTQGLGVAVDAQGFVYVAGTAGICNDATSTPDFQAFVAKISPDGSQLVWARMFRDADSWDEQARAITVSPAGDQIFVTGYSRVDTTVNTRLYVSKFDMNGNIVATFTLDNGEDNVGNGIRFVNNMVYVTGTVTIDDPVATTSLIVLKFDTNLVRDPTFGGVLYGVQTTGNSIAVNADTGDVFVGGTIGGPAPNTPQLLTLKVDAAGRPIDWAASRNASPDEISTVYSIALAHEDGGVLVYYTGEVNPNPSAQRTNLILGKLLDQGNSYSDIWGGSREWDAITGRGIVASDRRAHVAATYNTADLDTGVLKFGPGGDTLDPADVFHFGSAQNPATRADQGNGMDMLGNADYVTGSTLSGDFRVTQGVFQPMYIGFGDAFVAHITI
jgi:hypothetical protein